MAEIIKDKQKLKEIYSAMLTVESITPAVTDKDVLEVEEIMRHIAFSTPLLSIERGVCARIIEIKSKSKNNEDKILPEVNARFSKIKDFRSLIKTLSRTPYFGYSIFEVFYNEDFSIKHLEFIPRAYTRWDSDTQQWMLKGDSDYPLVDDGKFLVCTYNKTLEYPEGDKLLNYGLSTIYDDFIALEAKIRGLQQKYGSVIPVFAYDPDELDLYNSDGTENADPLKKVRARAESLKAVTDGSVMAIPVNSSYGLKDSFTYISLTDLKIDMQKQIMDDYDKRIEKFIKGSMFSDGSSGSYNKDAIQQDEKEKIEDDICAFISEYLYKLVQIDAAMFGYDPSDYYWSFEQDDGEELIAAREKKKAEVITEKMSAAAEAAKLGYTLDKEALAKILGIEPEHLLDKAVDTSLSEFASGTKKKSRFLLRKDL